MRVMKKLTATIFITLFAIPALAAGGKVNINKADARTLAGELDGLSQSQAEKIIKHRNKNGPFVGFYELDAIDGIDQDFFVNNYDRMELGDVSMADKKS